MTEEQIADTLKVIDHHLQLHDEAFGAMVASYVAWFIGLIVVFFAHRTEVVWAALIIIWAIILYRRHHLRKANKLLQPLLAKADQTKSQ